MGKIYQLGDEIKVEIGRANLAKRQLDFFLADEDPELPSSRDTVNC